MTLTVQLLGRPRVVHRRGGTYRIRSRKSLALLAYLILTDRPPSRRQVASLLFSGADDPLRALRWSLSELRRALGDPTSLDGDPIVLHLPPDAVVDVHVLTHRSWREAVGLRALGADLLEGVGIAGAPGFDSWLLSEQRRVAAASEAVLHEAALGSLSHGRLEAARDYAVRALAMSPLDENHHALLIRLYRLAGDDTAAERQFRTCAELLDRELGVAPGVAVRAAMRQTIHVARRAADVASIDAVVEAGSAAISAGATETGIETLRTAVALADDAPDPGQRVGSRLVLAEALIHSLRGRDEEGLAALHEADRIAAEHDDVASGAAARAELGYVDFLRARYDRADRWLTDALDLAQRDPTQASGAITAKATTYLGCVQSDRADYPGAVALLERGAELSRAAGARRQEAFGRAMLGRVALLTGDLGAAAAHLELAVDLATREHWLALLPWPQALQGHVHLAGGDLDRAARVLEQAFARACQLGDPCWEGIGARGLALAAEAEGDTERAFDLLADARARCNRLADPYVWLDAYILDAQAALGRRHGHPDTGSFVDALRTLASKTGMRELTVRALLHGADLGHPGDGTAARALAEEIDNPELRELVTTAARP